MKCTVLLSMLTISSVICRNLVTYCSGVRVVVPAGLNCKQRFTNFDDHNVLHCLDDLSGENIASIRIKKVAESSLCLEVVNLSQMSPNFPLLELSAKLCTASTGIHDIHVTNSNKQPLPLDMTILNPIESDEIIDWVSTNKDVLLPLPRRIVYKYNMLHRGFGAILLHANTNEIFVHKRTSTKRVFPSMLDMFIGGVSLHSEPVLSTLVREVEEEVGVDLRKTSTNDGQPANKEGTSVVYIGTHTIRTQMNHAVVDCFAVRLCPDLADHIQFKDGEIESGEWMTMKELGELLEGEGEKNFVPDGMQVWRALPSMLSKVPPISRKFIDEAIKPTTQ